MGFSKQALCIAKHTVSTNVGTSWDRAILAKEMGQINPVRLLLPTAFGPEDMMFSQLPEAQKCVDFGEDLAKEAVEIMKALGERREAWKTPFPSHSVPPASVRTDQSRSDAL